MDSVPVNFNHEFKKFYESIPNNKFKVDLEGIVRSQIKELKVPEENIDSVDIDTVTNHSWHSFRRDKEKSGRNISFVARFK
jgi:copper oxidase (laccase) domain-containing protein